MPTPNPAPKWSLDQLADDSAAALARFRADRMSEPLERYGEVFEARRDLVENFLEETTDLLKLRDLAPVILPRAGYLDVARYLAAPPISQDDLRALMAFSLATSRLRDNVDGARLVIDTIMQGLDARRFPWVREGREATEREKETAITSTVALIASQRVETDRRSESGRALEVAVGDALIRAGYARVEPRRVRLLDDAPRRGEFCGEAPFGSRKADLIVGLFDGRVLPIECKVSNSYTNSVKRLNNDAAKKAQTWLGEFGTNSVVPSAVLAGVYKVHNLASAQDDGLTLWWGHNLEALEKFAARQTD